MALSPDVPVMAPNDLITSSRANAVRSNLDRLDTTKVGTTGNWTMTGQLTANGFVATTASIIASAGRVEATADVVRSGGDPAAANGAQLAPDGGIRTRTNVAALASVYVDRPVGVAGEKYVTFRRGAVETGSIAQVGTSAVVYNTTSDARLKSDAGDVDLAVIERQLLALRVRRFTWDADPDAGEQLGLFAQEAAEHAGDAVTAGGDDPHTDPWSIDYSRLVPRLLAQVQYLTARVAALEAAP